MSEAGDAPAAVADPMDGIEVPKAEVPAAPGRMGAGLLAASPSFGGHAAEILGLQEAGRRLQDATARGRQLSFLALARLQRSDQEGAAAAVAEVKALPSLPEAIGEHFWERPEQRMQLCQMSGVGYFMETFIAVLGLQSFLERGVLAPEVPSTWLVGVKDYDDELYLLGTIGALRELERYAVGRGQQLDLRSVRLCLGVALSLEQALMQFNFRNSDLRQRFDGIKYAVKRLESLAYEIDLAQQRAAAVQAASGTPQAAANAGEAEAATGAEDPGAAAGEASAIDLKILGEIKVRYDAFDEQREQVMKRSRDVVKVAKNAIYALHREDFRKADTFLKQCAKDATDIHNDVISQYPRLRDGFFSSALEELAEALVYRAFRRDRQLLGLQEMQQESGLGFPMTLTEYLGGIMDLTGEVSRMAIRSASGGRKARPTVERCLACVDAVYNGLQELPGLPSRLSKKIGPLKQTLTKIEGVLYELALLSQGVSRRVEEAPGAEETMEE